MPKETCLVPTCGKEFENEAALHKHLKAHKLLLVEYYQTYYPRYDKFDKSIIKFRNKAQYLTTDFNSRSNLKQWLESVETNIAREYCRQILINRKEKKGIIWSPSQVELRSTMMPPIQVYNDLFGDYYELCKELGFKNRFDSKYSFEVSETKNPYFIYVDTREQLPLTFPTRTTEKRGLKFGDYACSNHDITCRCYVERKSIQDFVGTFSGGYERFCREVDRAVEAQAYLVVVVEEALNVCLDFQNAPHVYHKNTKVTPEYVFHNVRELIQKYENLQFVFVGGRERSAQAIEEIFDCNCSYKMVDLQLMQDIGML